MKIRMLAPTVKIRLILALVLCLIGACVTRVPIKINETWPGTDLIRFHYNGESVDGKPDGYGKAYGNLPDGRLWWEYEGDWRDGERHGTGARIEFVSPTPSIREVRYTGDWRAGKEHGRGVEKVQFVDGSAVTYTGDFENGLSHGDGSSQTFAAGVLIREYKGEYERGRAHGHGDEKNFLPNGQLRSHYVGEFRGGRYHGRGRLEFTAVDSDRHYVHDGYFNNGTFVGDVRPEP